MRVSDGIYTLRITLPSIVRKLMDIALAIERFGY